MEYELSEKRLVADVSQDAGKATPEFRAGLEMRFVFDERVKFWE